MKKNNKKNIKNVISISQPSLSTPSVAIEKSIKNNGISWGTFWTVILTSNTIILAFLIPIIFYYKSKNDASYLYCANSGQKDRCFRLKKTTYFSHENRLPAQA